MILYFLPWAMYMEHSLLLKDLEHPQVSLQTTKYIANF